MEHRNGAQWQQTNQTCSWMLTEVYINFVSHNTISSLKKIVKTCKNKFMLKDNASLHPHTHEIWFFWENVQTFWEGTTPAFGKILYAEIYTIIKQQEACSQKSPKPGVQCYGAPLIHITSTYFSTAIIFLTSILASTREVYNYELHLIQYPKTNSYTELSV